MSTDPHTPLLRLCDALSAHQNISHWRIAFLARGDGQFFDRLRKGRSCTLKTANGVLQWFAMNWPADLDWPRDIPRPPKAGKDAA
jgi:hypothetical protein